MMKPLRDTLISALHAREASLRNGRCHRKDLDALRAAIGRAWAFLNSYPVASDERVRTWCLAHQADIALIVPGNTPTVLARLVMDHLALKNEAA
jgi:hypothetical protein